MLYLPRSLKRCRKCGNYYLANKTSFGPAKTTKDRLKHECKSCQRAYRLCYERAHAKHVDPNVSKRTFVIDGHKRCKTCKRTLPATKDYFYVITYRDREKQSLFSECKQCITKRLRLATRTPIVETETHAVCLHCEKRLPLTDKNFPRIHGRLKRVCRDCERKSRNKNVEKAANARRRARKYNAYGTYTKDDVARQYKRQKGKCYWCNKKVGKKYHVDHVIPLSRGGSNDPSNLVISCPFCNTSKHNSLPHEWGDKLL